MDKNINKPDNYKSFVSQSHAKAKQEILLILQILRAEDKITQTSFDKIKVRLDSIADYPFDLLSELIIIPGTCYETSDGRQYEVVIHDPQPTT